MSQPRSTAYFPKPGDKNGRAPAERFYSEEVRLANRNRGMPLEALRYPVTPTGMHYMLTHFDVPYADAGDWRLAVGGLVNRALSLDLDDLMRRPAVTAAVTLECAGNGRALIDPRPVSQPWFLEAVGTAEWTGTPLRLLLDEAGIAGPAREIVFTGLDQGIQGEQVQYFERSLTVDEARRDEVLLAYAMNGRPLEPQHGYPLRLIVPGWYGMASVKWLQRIEAVAEPFQGYQMTGTYRYSKDPDEPGEPVTLMRVRSLMVPPGVPDFVTRGRLLAAGPVTLTGRAWAGRAAVARVEVSGDGGASWRDAELESPGSQHAWRGWRHRWEARPGRHRLCVRATDSGGNVQPMEPYWNHQGMGNNMVQQVEVVVEAGGAG